MPMMRLKESTDREHVCLSPRIFVAVLLVGLIALLTHKNARNVPESRPRVENGQTVQHRHT